MFPFKKKDGGSSKKSEKSEDDKKSGGGGFGKFWKQFVLRKGPQEEEGSEPMTSDQKSLLAAEVASGSLGLDSKAREQVAKAIAAEMRRRHEEREKRRSELMNITAVKLPWGAKHQPPAPKSARKSLGASMYPIKMELKEAPTPKGAKAGKSGKSGKAEPEAHTWDDSAWRPVSAVGPTGPSLEKDRKAWIEKSLKAAMGPTGKSAVTGKSQVGSKKSAKEAPRAASPAAEQGDSSSSSFGAQPTAIQMDEATVNEIHAHTFGQMLQNIIMEAAQQQQLTQTQKAKSSAKAAPKTKKPEDMTADELIELRKRDPTAWDKHTRQNTVISFGLTTPTDDDVERGKKSKGKKPQRKLHFDDEIEVNSAPVGRDYHFNEKTTRGKDVLKK